MTTTVTASEITAAALEARITALRPSALSGPGWVGVRSCIASARQAHRSGDYESCAYWLDQGAFHAGLITAAEFWDADDVREAHAAAARITREGQQS